MKQTSETQKETVGRQYTKLRYGLHSRKRGEQAWYGTSHYRTEEEAIAALKQLGKRIQTVGCITVDFGEAAEMREYRIVREESACTVTRTFEIPV